MSHDMPPVPRQYEPHDGSQIGGREDTPEEAICRAEARAAWCAARKSEMADGQPPQRF